MPSPHSQLSSNVPHLPKHKTFHNYSSDCKSGCHCRQVSTTVPSKHIMFLSLLFLSKTVILGILCVRNTVSDIMWAIFHDQNKWTLIAGIRNMWEHEIEVSLLFIVSFYLWCSNVLFVVALIVHSDRTFKTVLHTEITFCKSSKKKFWPIIFV